MTSSELDRAIRRIKLYHVADSTSLKAKTDDVAVEQDITIMIDKVGSFTILCTPADIKALAVGFAYTEGMIEGFEDVISVSIKPDIPNVVGITVHDPSKIAIQRNMIVASSCGMCGQRNIEKMLAEIIPCQQSLEMSVDKIAEVVENMRSKQLLFEKTGGSHAAAIFTSDGQITAFAEDIGRHNALDKAIGKSLLTGRSTKGCGVALSGRVSLEMVTKAAKAGIELVIGLSAPSSFAIEAALKWNITLCGFVRSPKANIYTHPERIKEIKTK